MHLVHKEDGHIRVPLDMRWPILGLWISGIALLADDSRDGALGLDGAWGGMLALIAAVSTMAMCLRHSRRVIMEVMSYEHRRISSEIGAKPPVTLVNRER